MRKWIPLVAILLGTFMLLVDVTIVNVALPSVARSLHTSFTSLQWVIDAYALALAALLLGIGALADNVGHRRMYLLGLGVFAVASFICGISPNAGSLIAARAVQGVGAAAMFATTFALLNKSYSGRDRGMAFGLWGAVAGASAALGPILGGALVQGLSWRWVFFVNLPVSVLALVMSLRTLSADGAVRRGRLDLTGMATFTLAAAALTLGLIRTGDHGWGATTWLLLALSAVSLAAFVAVEAHGQEPLLDLGLFRGRSFVGTMVAALLVNFTAYSLSTYTTIWLQSLIGLSPLEAGLATLPLAGVSFFTAAALGRVLEGAAPGPLIGGGLTLIGAGGLLTALLLRDGSSWPALIPGYVLVGLGSGLATPTLVSAAMGAVPMRKGGMASGAVNTARQLGYALGIALLGSVIGGGASASLKAHSGAAGIGNPDLSAHLLVGGQAPVLLARAGSGRGRLDSLLRIAEVHGLVRASVLVGVLGVAFGALSFRLIRPSVAGPTTTHEQPGTPVLAAS